MEKRWRPASSAARNNVNTTRNLNGVKNTTNFKEKKDTLKNGEQSNLKRDQKSIGIIITKYKPCGALKMLSTVPGGTGLM
jgi:hypothetical protein